jgi:molybdate transport system regulatory protein
MAGVAGDAQIGGRLWIDKGREGFLGRGRVELLAAIDEHGSISAAARHLGISYKAAWDRVDAMNNLAEAPLVLRETGGKGGGGTRLTDEGRRLIAVFRHLEQEYERWLDGLNERLSGADQFLSIVRGFGMRTSARNQLRGRVKALHVGEINTEVVVALDDGLELVAVITHESVEGLGLAPGREVQALIKSSFVILTDDEGLRSSARNRLCGRVTRIVSGPVESEVTLEIGPGKTLAAVITTPSLESLGLEEGGRACALVKAPHVILAVNE